MVKSFQELKTDESLLATLKAAGSRKLTSDEIFAQRVSFVFGSMPQDSGVTREQVKHVIAEQQGRPVEGVK